MTWNETNESEDRVGPKPGDIVLFSEAVGIAGFTRIFARAKFLHVAIDAGEGYVVEARGSGVVERRARGDRNDLGSQSEAFAACIAVEPTFARAALRWARARVEPKGAGKTSKEPSARPLSAAAFVLEAFRETGLNLLPEVSLRDATPDAFIRLEPASLVPADKESSASSLGTRAEFLTNRND